MTPDEIKANRPQPTMTREAIAAKLSELRHQFDPEDWPGSQSDSVLLLSDVCEILGLNDAQKLHVLGIQGKTYEQNILGACYHLLPKGAAHLAQQRQPAAPAQPGPDGLIRERVCYHNAGSIDLDTIIAEGQALLAQLSAVKEHANA